VVDAATDAFAGTSKPYLRISGDRISGYGRLEIQRRT